MKESAAQKLLSKPWWRGKMQYTCVVHSYLNWVLVRFPRTGKNYTFFLPAYYCFGFATSFWNKVSIWKNYSVSTTASSLNCHFQFLPCCKSCTKTAKQRKQFMFTPGQRTWTFLHVPLHLLQLWQLLTLWFCIKYKTEGTILQTFALVSIVVPIESH